MNHEAAPASHQPVTILGIGNLLWADEGFGVRAIEALNRDYEFAHNVRLIDGGTQGIYLVQHVQYAEILVVFDAVDYGLPPGTLKCVEGEDVPNFMGAKKMSLHQTGFQEVLAMARLLGGYPRRLLLIGVQPERLEDYGGSLRPCVQARIEPAIEVALQWLAEQGVSARARNAPLPVDEGLGPLPIRQSAYEAGRPAHEQACRTGDARVLNDARMRFDPKAPPGDTILDVALDARIKS